MLIDLNRQTSWHSRQYPPEFNRAFKRSIHKRDGYRCAVCKRKKKRLDTHHIDYTKRTVPENCISLCHSCHFSLHRSNRYNQTLWQNKLARIARSRQHLFEK